MFCYYYWYFFPTDAQKEYQKAVEEKIRYEKELEHETYSMHDLQLELDHYQQAIIRLSIKDDFQKELDQLDHIEGNSRKVAFGKRQTINITFPIKQLQTKI